MRILLTDGAGLASRQAATRLDDMGHDVSALVSDRLCLARFTRHVRTLHMGPPFGDDPLRWFDRLLEVALEARIDVVFPTQEQVTVLSHQLPRLTQQGVATAVPPFDSLRQVQDKASAFHTLQALGVPQPRTTVVLGAGSLQWDGFPAYVKAAVGTGSQSVRRVRDHAELVAAIESLTAQGATVDGGVLVQEAIPGNLVMAQCVFDRGVLVAFHANERFREGANGSAAVKVSVAAPVLQKELMRMGRELQWHGALSVDAVTADGGPLVIDVNPRLVEPGNALASGTDLVGALIAVALGERVAPLPPSRTGVRTHQLLMAILGAAQLTGRRREVLRESVLAATRRGTYADSLEELLPPAHDRRTLLLPLAAILATSVRPRWYRAFTDGAVNRYSLAPRGWRQLLETPPHAEVTTATA